MLTKKPRTRRKKDGDFEPMLVFRNVDVTVVVDSDLYDEKESDKIAKIVEAASKNICIDKSYVAYEGTKYEKTFFKEEGWNEFKKLLKKTNYGKKCTAKDRMELSAVYTIMIQCYLYQFLEDYEYDSSGICIELEEGVQYIAEVYKDETTGWKSYPGKWQTW